MDERHELEVRVNAFHGYWTGAEYCRISMVEDKSVLSRNVNTV
jgi:hypothetical protein